jgi:catechol 2,3-dioxygenase-like lactoylglutathione lyase family enzyme
MEKTKIHHMAIIVKNIEESINFYKNNFNCEIKYQDKTWGMLEFENINLSFVLESQHPAHICFETTKENANFITHRDGTKGFYSKDNSGNVIEFLKK